MINNSETLIDNVVKDVEKVQIRQEKMNNFIKEYKRIFLEDFISKKQTLIEDNITLTKCLNNLDSISSENKKTKNHKKKKIETILQLQDNIDNNLKFVNDILHKIK